MSDDRGLYKKFHVMRVDAQDGPGDKHDGCEYFVLDLDHDPHALAALRAYALSCEKDRPQLSIDLLIKIKEVWLRGLKEDA